MKRTLLGYSPREVQARIDALVEQNTLLMNRLERQDEQIKELNARYSSFITAESKLKSSSRVVTGSLTAIEEGLAGLRDVASMSQDASGVLNEVRVTVERACRILERNARTEEVLLRAQQAIGEAVAVLNEQQAEELAREDAEQVVCARGAADAVDEKLAQGSRALTGIEAELEGLQGAVDAIVGVANQLGRLGNSVSADIERARVAAMLEKSDAAPAPEASVRVSSPDALIANYGMSYTTPSGAAGGFSPSVPTAPGVPGAYAGIPISNPEVLIGAADPHASAVQPAPVFPESRRFATGS